MWFNTNSSAQQDATVTECQEIAHYSESFRRRQLEMAKQSTIKIPDMLTESPNFWGPVRPEVRYCSSVQLPDFLTNTHAAPAHSLRCGAPTTILSSFRVSYFLVELFN
jgi:hypothetical protein